MFVYKKLKASDVGITAFEAHKEFNVNKDNTSSLGVSLIDSSFSSASRDSYSGLLVDTNNHKKYFQLDHLFYNDAIFNYGSLLGGLEYNQQEKRLYNKATIISISQKNFGSGIQKGTFDFNNNYIDDSKGNLYSKTSNLDNFPKDKERPFYLGPVKGHKYFDLTRNSDTGEKIVNFSSTFSDFKLDDSLYTNIVEYISCSFSEDTVLNCPVITLDNGYIKAPHSKNYNFGNEDFTITFWYKPTSTNGPKFILGKSTTKTVVETPESSTNGNLSSTHGSASFLQPKEVDAGRAFPFEVLLDDSNKIKFSRSDQDNNSSVTYNDALTNDTFSHVAVRKKDNELKIFINGDSGSNSTVDSTDLCKNEADLFIGSQGGTRENISYNKEHKISQIMIFNKGLTHEEIKNVSSSISGTPFVGNIFYEQGIATLTAPTVNNNTLTSLQTQTETITLLPTPFSVGEETINDFPEILTFSGSNFTFVSPQENLGEFGASTIFNNLDFDTTKVGASFNEGNNKISLFSLPTSSVATPNFLLTINSSSLELNLDSESDFSTADLFTSSNDTVNDRDNESLTETISIDGGRRVRLTTPKTFTASFTIDPATPTTITDERWTESEVQVGDIFTGGGGNPFNFNGINDLSDDTIFNTIGGGGNTFAAGFTAVNTDPNNGIASANGDGEITFSGSAGMVAPFFVGTLPRVEMGMNSGVVNTFVMNTSQKTQNLFGADNNLASSISFNGGTHGQVLNAAMPSTTKYEDFYGPDGNDTIGFNRADVYYNAATFGNNNNSEQGTFQLGHMAKNGNSNKFFSRYSRSPGHIKFRFSFEGFKSSGTSNTITVELQRRILKHDGTVLSGFTEVSQLDGNADAFSLTTTNNTYNIDYRFGQSFADNQFLTNEYYGGGDPDNLNLGPKIQFRFVVKKIGGGSTTITCAAPKINVIDQQRDAGFYSTLAIQTDIGSNNPITAKPGDIIKYTVNGIKTKQAGVGNNLNFSNTANRLTSGSFSAVGSNPGFSDFEAARLYIMLFRQDETIGQFGPNLDHELLNIHEFKSEDNSYQSVTSNSDEDLIGHYVVPSDIVQNDNNNTKFFLRIMVGGDIDPINNQPNILRVPQSHGFSLRNILIEKFGIPDNYTISNVTGTPPLINSNKIHKQLGQDFLDLVNTGNTENLLKSNVIPLLSVTFDSSLIQNGNLGNSGTQINGTFLNPSRIEIVENLNGNFGDKVRFGNQMDTLNLGATSGILVTESMAFTASIEVQANVEVTSSFTPPNKGLYTIDNINLNTQFIGINNKVAVQVFKNGVLYPNSSTGGNDGGTRLVNFGLNGVNAFNENPLTLGVLEETDNISFVFKSVSASSEIEALGGGTFAASFESGGFNRNQFNATPPGNHFDINKISITKLSSSNEIAFADGSTFTEDNGIIAGHFVEISSSHIDQGTATYPFNIGQSTASIISISDDGETATLDTDFFITSSIAVQPFIANFFEKGPFQISASFTPSGLDAFLNSKIYNINTVVGSVTHTNDPGLNLGLGYKIDKTIGTNAGTLAESFADNATSIALNTELRIPNTPETDPIIFKYFVSGVLSNDYPDGAVTTSLDYTQSFNPIIQFTAISGSNVSSGPTISAGEFSPFTGFSSNKLKITSSHGAFNAIGPAFNVGQFTANIIDRTSDGNIEVDQVLFITGSSQATGSSPSSSITPGDITFSATNLVDAVGVTEQLIGGTFTFDNFATPATDPQTYIIQDILGVSDQNPNANIIQISNQDGGSSDIQTIDENDLDGTTSVEVDFLTQVPNEFTLDFKNNHLIFENEYHCTVDEHEYNFTLNPTARKLKSITDGELANFATGSKFKPYVTTVGLYNDEGELLVVGKLGQPMRMSDKTDTTFVVRYDT